MRVDLKHVQHQRKVLADGTVVFYDYHRKAPKGQRRIQGQPDSPEFIASFAAAEKLVSDRHHGTFVSLVRAYLTSIKFESLSLNTKNDYRRLLTAAESEFGDMPIGALNDPGVLQVFIGWHERCVRINGAKQADYRLQAISAMLTWAVKHGKIQI